MLNTVGSLTLWDMLVSRCSEIVHSALVGPSEVGRQVVHIDISAWKGDSYPLSMLESGCVWKNTTNASYQDIHL